MGMQQPQGDLRHAKWLDPECYEPGACQSLKFKAQHEAMRDEIARLRTALRFYARGEHYHLDESEEFDTVSGEPQNWLCSGREDSATMVENGRVALFALQGIDANWIDGDEDCTPQPVDGEVSCAT